MMCERYELNDEMMNLVVGGAEDEEVWYKAKKIGENMYEFDLSFPLKEKKIWQRGKRISDTEFEIHLFSDPVIED